MVGYRWWEEAVGQDDAETNDASFPWFDSLETGINLCAGAWEGYMKMIMKALCSDDIQVLGGILCWRD